MLPSTHWPYTQGYSISTWVRIENIQDLAIKTSTPHKPHLYRYPSIFSSTFTLSFDPLIFFFFFKVFFLIHLDSFHILNVMGKMFVFVLKQLVLQENQILSKW